MANLVDTGVNGDLRVTGNIYGNLSGNATTATTWATGREFKIQDADATNTGTTVTGVNGSGNVTLKLPSTIKATLTGNATTCTYPYGFASRTSTLPNWGTLKDSTKYDPVTIWNRDSTEIVFAKDKSTPSGHPNKTLSVQVDGYFYQNEGTYRVLDTSDGMTCGLCNTAAGTAAKVASAMNYTASVGNTILVRFANTNSAAGALTLNLGGQTKTIKWNGTVTASGTTSAIPAGTWPCYYDGTYWNIWTNGATAGMAFNGGLGPKGACWADGTVKKWIYLGKIARKSMPSGSWSNLALLISFCRGIDTQSDSNNSIDTYLFTCVASANHFCGKFVLLNRALDATNRSLVIKMYTQYDSTNDAWLLYVYCNTDASWGNIQIHELVSISSHQFYYDPTGIRYLSEEPSRKTEITGYISALFPSSITDNQVVLTSGANGMLKTAAIGSSSGQIAAGNHTHSNASTTAAGFMSASDYQRLNGSQNIGEHDANNCTTNGLYYGSSNMPPTDLGASTTDDALYVEAWSTSWVAQIAQDYRNGNLFVRSKNNGTWQSWRRIPYLTVKNRGGTTTPVYVDTNGEIQSCTAYAGGTAVTLNNSSKAGSTASFYAPTAGGTANYVLIGNGATSAPTWAEKAPKAVVADKVACTGDNSNIAYFAMLGSNAAGNYNLRTLPNLRAYYDTNNGVFIELGATGGTASVTRCGHIRLGNGAYQAFIRVNDVTTNRNIYIPDADGKFVVTNRTTAIGNTTNPVYVDASGTVQWCTAYSSATVGNTNNVKVTASDAQTYLTGVTTAPSSSNQYLANVANANVYATAGKLHATTFDVNSKCTLQFNSTTNALDFVFA